MSGINVKMYRCKTEFCVVSVEQIILISRSERVILFHKQLNNCRDILGKIYKIYLEILFNVNLIN